MNDTQIRALVKQLDTKDRVLEESAWDQLRSLGAEMVPFLAEYYPQAKQMEGRRAIVFHAIKYARASEAAFQLGIAALSDRASIVRYRACGVLAYSLRREALPHLEALLKHDDPKTVQDAHAGIDAIKCKNHHYFVDRDHTGRLFWRVNDGEAPTG